VLFIVVEGLLVNGWLKFMYLLLNNICILSFLVVFALVLLLHFPQFLVFR